MSVQINTSTYSWYFIKSLGKLLLNPQKWQSQLLRVQLNWDLLKVAGKPRYTPMKIELFRNQFELLDSDSFVWTYYEIFGEEIYKFESDNTQPLIIDCGANIGLSVLYFKKLYPKSRIIAFEPDIQLFDILQKNIQNFGCSEVELIRKAVWNSKTVLEFISEGGDAGRLSQKTELQANKYPVETVRLRDYLNQPIDLLKIDIEGAETEVIKDCSDLLFNVKKLFIEYHSFVNKPQSLNILIDILSQAGFRLHFHTVNKSPKPLFKQEDFNGMDMQLNIFAWQEK